MQTANTEVSNVSEVKTRQSARSKRKMIALTATTAAALIFAVVRGTTAQEAPAGMSANTPAASSTTGQRSSGNDMIADGPDKDGHLHVTVNHSTVVTTKVPYKRVSVGNPEIADVNPIGPNNILLTAKKSGNTQLIVWDDADRSQVIEVNVEFDLQSLSGQMHKMFPGSTIEVSEMNGALALSGRVPSLEVAQQAAAMASPYSAKVLNLMTVSGGKQVMLQVRFAEVSRSASSELGVNLGYSDNHSFGASNIGQVNPFTTAANTGTAGATLIPGAANSAVTVFGQALFGQTALNFYIDALRSNNLLRMLAEPNLIATSGQEASFLAGGEFPVPVTQGGGGSGGTAVTVEYREFGVRLKFVPIILGDGRIRLQCAPEVSDLDFTTAVRFNGFVIPGLTSRKVNTTVELAEGQTFAIAGLLNNNMSASKDVTPLLGDLPVLGVLFRSVRYTRKETELVVLVTPHLVDGMNPDQVPAMPGEHWRNPSEGELFWNRDLGGEIGASKPVSIVNATTQPTASAPAAAIDSPTLADESSKDADTSKGNEDFGFAPASQPTESASAGQ